MNFRGIRFLLTQPMIHGINGSTMVTLELAEYLSSEGADVKVYTYYCGEPARGLFANSSIDIVEARDSPVLRLEDFDYIWVHSQVLPVSIVEALGRELPRLLPRFIFLHMSPFDWIPDERPYIYGLEQRLSSKSLFITEETMQEQGDYYGPSIEKDFFRNPAPKAFAYLSYRPPKRLRRILVVSNHPPNELIEAQKLLKKGGIEIVFYGENSETYNRITPAILSKYEVVITIGKTVQYALVAGVPVYIYDHFGGIGYLNARNYKTAASRNFSGRDGRKHSSSYLAKDIASGYAGAVEFQSEHRQEFIDNFSIDRVLPNVLGSIKPRSIKKFSKLYCSSVVSAQIFAKIRFVVGAGEVLCGQANKSLTASATELKDSIARLSNELSRSREVINRLEQERASIAVQYERVVGSKTFRLGSAFVWPYRMSKTLLDKLRKKSKNLS